MILFKPEMAEAILAGRKTVTRRRWKTCRVKVGNVYQARTQMLGKPFARLQVVSVEQERMPGDAIKMGHFAAEAEREGFITWMAFERAYMEMHGPDAIAEPCYRVAFEVVP